MKKPTDKQLRSAIYEVASCLPDPVPDSWSGRKWVPLREAETVACIRRAWAGLRTLAVALNAERHPVFEEASDQEGGQQ